MLLIGIFGLCQGLSYPLLSLILQKQGVSPALIGLNTAMMPLGILVSAVLLPAAARRFGSVQVALASLVLEATLFLLIGAFKNVWFWFPARFLLGWTVSGVYVTSETWINSLAPTGMRGRILGIFATALSLGFALGPFVLVGTGIEGWPPFAAAAAIVGSGAVLVVLVFNRLPAVDSDNKASVWQFLPLAPFLLGIVLIVAAYDQSFLSLFPVYSTAKGLSESEISVAVTAWASGNILFQVPIGTLADRWSRRGTMILLCTTTVTGALLLPLAEGSPMTLWPLLFVWGPSSYGVYLLSLLELGERFEGSTLLAGNASFSVMWGIGGTAGPPIVGAAMTRGGPIGFPLTLAAIYGTLLVMVCLRRSR